MRYDTARQAHDDLDLLREINATFEAFARHVPSIVALMSQPMDLEDFLNSLDDLRADTLGVAEKTIHQALTDFAATADAREIRADRADFHSRLGTGP